MLRGIPEHGLNMFEFCPEYLEQTADVLGPVRRKEALALAHSLGVKLIVHASYASVNICFMNDHTRAESIRQLKREIQLAHDLESDVITIHPGLPTGVTGFYSPEYFRDMLCRSYEELLDFAEPLGVRICAENLDTEFVGTEEHFARLFARLDCSHFGLCFDFGHHNLIYNDRALSERTEAAKRFFRRFGEKIWVLHVHDNNGLEDQHIGIGKGEIEFDVLIPDLLGLGLRPHFSMELDTFDDVRISREYLGPYLGL